MTHFATYNPCNSCSHQGDSMCEICVIRQLCLNSNMEYQDDGGNYFVGAICEYNITNPLEILNWYRNLYYKEGDHTERGIMSMAINDLFMKYKKELNL